MRLYRYARSHDPAVYRGIMNNPGFRRAFSAIARDYGLECERFYRDLSRELARPEYESLINNLAAP